MRVSIEEIGQRVGCEVRCDHLTRQLYATDASVYQIVPQAVAFPKSAAEAAAITRAAAEAGIPVTFRGAGTGLAGGALGSGLIVELARYNRQISGLDRERRTIRVGAGVVLDELNEFLRPHGLWFGPDVATSSRATLGGMIANNSSGARAGLYGTTSDHVAAVEVVLADGRMLELRSDAATDRDRERDAERGGWEFRAAADAITARYEPHIRARLAPGLVKRWPGYAFDRYLRHPGDLTQLIGASEGTLAGIVSAELRLVPLPSERGLGVIFFASVAEAMQATVELLDLRSAAIEHVDRLLFDQTRGRMEFGPARGLLGLDDPACEAFLMVEFFDEGQRQQVAAVPANSVAAVPGASGGVVSGASGSAVPAGGTVGDRLAALAARRLGLRTLICRDAAEQALVWGLRKAGLTVLTSHPGPAKPVAGVEDVAVRPGQLPEYVADLRGILERLGVRGSFYGHAACGLLHVRPVLDLHTKEGIASYRNIAEEVFALVRQYRGSICGEHGVGMARSEFLPGQLGPELMQASRELKRAFDPANVLNPGKIIPDGRYRIDADLRQGARHEITLPLPPVLGFVERDGSFVGNLEQCNGNGACLKSAPVMCPTYIATHEEIMSTRGRANTIRAALEGRLDDDAGALLSPELEAALGPCLSCKACKRECPSNVDLALLKAELLHTRHRRAGVPLVDRIIAAADLLGRVGSTTAPLSNAMLRSPVVRRVMEWALGINAERALPTYARVRFDRWFHKRLSAIRSQLSAAHHSSLVLWDDTWVRYHEPGIGVAAVRVLEAAGFKVLLAEGRRCCGRPAFSRGLLDEAAEMGRHNLALLTRAYPGLPIVFLEPSCYSMFVDEYRQLRLPGADEVAARCRLFEQFMDEVLEREPRRAAGFSPRGLSDGVKVSLPCHVAIHAHCHARALTDVGVMPRLAARLAARWPGLEVELLDTGCCGMAGAYGMMKKNDALSQQVAGPMIEKLKALPAGTCVVASGTSCRQQIRQLTGLQPLHMAELLDRYRSDE